MFAYNCKGRRLFIYGQNKTTIHHSVIQLCISSRFLIRTTAAKDVTSAIVVVVVMMKSFLHSRQKATLSPARVFHYWY